MHTLGKRYSHAEFRILLYLILAIAGALAIYYFHFRTLSQPKLTNASMGPLRISSIEIPQILISGTDGMDVSFPPIFNYIVVNPPANASRILIRIQGPSINTVQTSTDTINSGELDLERAYSDSLSFVNGGQYSLRMILADAVSRELPISSERHFTYRDPTQPTQPPSTVTINTGDAPIPIDGAQQANGTNGIPASAASITLSSDQSTGSIPLTVHLTAIAHSIPPCSVGSWQWGDGTTHTAQFDCPSTTTLMDTAQQFASYTFTTVGTYIVRMNIGDTASNPITIVTVPPPLNFSVIAPKNLGTIDTGDAQRLSIQYQLNSGEPSDVRFSLQYLQKPQPNIPFERLPEIRTPMSAIQRVTPDSNSLDLLVNTNSNTYPGDYIIRVSMHSINTPTPLERTVDIRLTVRQSIVQIVRQLLSGIPMGL